jgi:hypothetical protein
MSDANLGLTPEEIENLTGIKPPAIPPPTPDPNPEPSLDEELARCGGDTASIIQDK